MKEFKDEELQETYEKYMKELEEIKELLSEVGTPYAILAWWYTREYCMKRYFWYSGIDLIECVRLAAIFENEVETILHKHFTDDMIVEYRKMFAQDVLIRLEREYHNHISGY